MNIGTRILKMELSGRQEAKRKAKEEIHADSQCEKRCRGQGGMKDDDMLWQLLGKSKVKTKE